MKSYISKYFGDDYIKNVNLHDIGVYYSVPVKDIYENKREEFEFDTLEDNILLDKYTIDSGEYIENWDNIDYDYTDEIEYYDTIDYLMDNKKYDKFLVVLFNARWNGASGARIFDNYEDCFNRGYDCSMFVSGSSKTGKYLKLREYHHDVPMGHSSIIIGLTDREYQKLENKDIQSLINYANGCMDKIIEL